MTCEWGLKKQGKGARKRSKNDSTVVDGIDFMAWERRSLKDYRQPTSESPPFESEEKLSWRAVAHLWVEVRIASRRRTSGHGKTCTTSSSPFFLLLFVYLYARRISKLLEISERKEKNTETSPADGREDFRPAHTNPTWITWSIAVYTVTVKWWLAKMADTDSEAASSTFRAMKALFDIRQQFPPSQSWAVPNVIVESTVKILGIFGKIITHSVSLSKMERKTFRPVLLVLIPFSSLRSRHFGDRVLSNFEGFHPDTRAYVIMYIDI